MLIRTQKFYSTSAVEALIHPIKPVSVAKRRYDLSVDAPHAFCSSETLTPTLLTATARETE